MTSPVRRGLTLGTSGYFFSVNRGKRSICIDLPGTSRGRETFLRLAENADVVMENFTPGTMGRSRAWI